MASLSIYDMTGLAPRMKCFILMATRLSNKLLEQGYVKERLKLSVRKFYGSIRGFLSNNTKLLSHEC